MPAEKKLTQCCCAPACYEPLCLVGVNPGRQTFGRVPVCSKCARIVGDTKLDWAAPAEAKNKFNGTSWAMMLEERKKRPGCPLCFVVGSGGILLPEGYTGELKAQPDLTEDVPF